MTTNQIAFYKAKNDREHNIAQEEISRQANRIAQQQADTTRDHYIRSDAEAGRSNRANESINRFKSLTDARNADTNAKNASINAFVAKTKDDANAINAFKAVTDRAHKEADINLKEQQAYKTQREGDVVYLNTASRGNAKTLLGLLPTMNPNFTNTYTERRPASGSLKKRR